MSKRQAHELEEAEDASAKRRNDFSCEDKDDCRDKPWKLAVPIPPLSSPDLIWKSSEIPTALPPLPKILNVELEKCVFRHPGISTRTTSYERLEWFGDAQLESIASGLIWGTFIEASAGKCSQLRELLICNKNLATYFRGYGLDSRAQLPPDVDKFRGQGKSNDKDMIKIHADMFEAFVAAAMETDQESTFGWLKALFSRTIKEQILENENKLARVGQAGSGQAQLSAKDQLRLEIGAKNVTIRYEDLPGPAHDRRSGLPLFTIGVYLDGWGEINKLLGCGTGLGKKEAGQNAAKNALEKKKLINMYKVKKEASANK